MEKFQEAREKARKNIEIADYMLFQTYPTLKDSKLLLSVIENVFLAFTNSMGAILYYERLFKRIPPFTDNFDSKFNMFRLKCVDKFKVSTEHVSAMTEIKSLILSHRKSPVEFARKDKFVMCSNNYKLKTISVDSLKDYIGKAKLFFDHMNEIVRQNEHIFR